MKRFIKEALMTILIIAITIPLTFLVIDLIVKSGVPLEKIREFFDSGATVFIIALAIISALTLTFQISIIRRRVGVLDNALDEILSENAGKTTVRAYVSIIKMTGLNKSYVRSFFAVSETALYVILLTDLQKPYQFIEIPFSHIESFKTRKSVFPKRKIATLDFEGGKMKFTAFEKVNNVPYQKENIEKILAALELKGANSQLSEYVE